MVSSIQWPSTLDASFSIPFWHLSKKWRAQVMGGGCWGSRGGGCHPWQAEHTARAHPCLLAPLRSVHVSNSDQPLVPSLLCLPVHYTVSNGHCPCVTQVMLCPTHVTLTWSTLQHPVSKIMLHFAPSHKPPQHNHFCPCGFHPSSSFRRKVYLCPSIFVQLADIIVDANAILLLICRILPYPTDQNNKQRKATVSF